MIFLSVAVLAAGAAGILIRAQIERRSAVVQVPMVKVVVAAADVPEATALKTEQLTVIEWPRSSVPDGTVAEVSSLVGRVAITHMVRGEVVLPSKLATDGVGMGLSALLPESMRAVAVRVDDVVGVAGFVHPGDTVDVIATMKPDGNADAPDMSKVVLQRVKVLAVGRETERKAEAPDKAATVATLMVTPDDAERLALAASRGQILLALRGPTDESSVRTPGMIAAQLLDRAVGTLAKASGAGESGRGRSTPTLPTSGRRVVEILRGDLIESRTFPAEVVP